MIATGPLPQADMPALYRVADVLAFQGGHARDDIAIVAVRVPRN